MALAYYRNWPVFILETIGLPVLFLGLFKLFPWLLAYRTYIMLSFFIYIFVFIKREKLSWLDLGLTSKKFLPAIKALILPSLAAAGLILIGYWLQLSSLMIPEIIKDVNSRPPLVTALRYILFSVPVQEVLCRLYLINRLERLRRQRIFNLIYAAALFGALHMAFDNPFLTFGSLALGWIWAANFMKYKNLFAVIISHSLIGLVYILLMA